MKFKDLFLILKQVQVTWKLKHIYSTWQVPQCRVPVKSHLHMVVTPINQLEQSQRTTLLLPPFHLVKALVAGKRIHLDTAHKHLQEKLPARKHAITFTCYACKKGQSSKKTRYTGERAQGKGHHNKYSSYKEIWASSPICIPSKRSAQTRNLKPTHQCLPTVLYFQLSATGGKLCGQSWE